MLSYDVTLQVEPALALRLTSIATLTTTRQSSGPRFWLSSQMG